MGKNNGRKTLFPIAGVGGAHAGGLPRLPGGETVGEYKAVGLGVARGEQTLAVFELGDPRRPGRAGDHRGPRVSSTWMEIRRSVVCALPSRSNLRDNKKLSMNFTPLPSPKPIFF